MNSLCFKENEAYLKCKAKDSNPESCLLESMAIRKCAFFLADKYMSETGCPLEFDTYTKCLKENEFVHKECFTSRVMFESCVTSKFVFSFFFFHFYRELLLENQ
jgi:hypothetical protein